MIFPLNLHLQMIFLLKPHLQTIFPLKPPFADDFPCIFRGLAMKKHVNDPGVTPRRSKLEGSIRCFGNLEPSFSRTRWLPCLDVIWCDYLYMVYTLHMHYIYTYICIYIHTYIYIYTYIYSIYTFCRMYVYITVDVSSLSCVSVCGYVHFSWFVLCFLWMLRWSAGSIPLQVAAVVLKGRRENQQPLGNQHRYTNHDKDMGKSYFTMVKSW